MCTDVKTDLAAALRFWLAPLAPVLPPLYLVGGAVRDWQLGRPIKDIDLVCDDPETLARRIARYHRGVMVPFAKKAAAPCFRVARRGHGAHFIDLAAICGGSLAADLARRDFTINAMAAAIDSGARLAEVIDPLGGRADLARKTIRAASARAMEEDPLRILRAARLAAVLDFVIDADTLDLMGRSAPGLARVAAERVSAELLALLSAPRAVGRLRLLDRTGALAVMLPETAAMKGCVQNGHHHRDVWGHSLEALAACEEILATADAHFGAQAPDLRRYLETGGRTALLKLAVLLHDSGKPACRKVDPVSGRITFHGHDAAGARLVEAVGRRLRLPARAAAFAGSLAAHHMHLLALSAPQVRPATILRWCRRLGDASLAALILSMADVAAIRGPQADPAWRERHLNWAACTVRDYFADYKPRIEARPLITGRDLLDAGMAAGPRMGRILATVRDAQQTGAVSTRKAALALARGLWKDDISQDSSGE